jgi:hypothetical protein
MKIDNYAWDFVRDICDLPISGHEDDESEVIVTSRKELHDMFLSKLEDVADDLFDHIRHGDEKHQDWLRAELDKCLKLIEG